jgi:hypothetical protein
VSYHWFREQWPFRHLPCFAYPAGTQCHPVPQRFAASTIGALAAAAVRLFGAGLAAPAIDEAAARQMMVTTINAKRIPLSLGAMIIQAVSCAS